MFSLVVGHCPAGQDHQGEGGKRQAVNGVAGQGEACPLGYLSQEVGPGHKLKHSACGWGGGRELRDYEMHARLQAKTTQALE